MSELLPQNPVWYILIVNIIALVLVPFLGYRYTHKNNMKILREKWIAEFRTAVSYYITTCTELYQANDMRYSKLNGETKLSDQERTSYIKAADEASAKAHGASAKIRLLFKNNDSDYELIKPLLQALVNSASNPTEFNDQRAMCPKAWSEAQSKFLEECNTLLFKEWNSISS